MAQRYKTPPPPPRHRLSTNTMGQKSATSSAITSRAAAGHLPSFDPACCIHQTATIAAVVEPQMQKPARCDRFIENALGSATKTTIHPTANAKSSTLRNREPRPSRPVPNPSTENYHRNQRERDASMRPCHSSSSSDSCGSGPDPVPAGEGLDAQSNEPELPARIGVVPARGGHLVVAQQPQRLPPCRSGETSPCTLYSSASRSGCSCSRGSAPGNQAPAISS